MASGHQVALTTVQRRATAHLNRTARQVVPAFLQKLYEMVSDASNTHLIQWSESGDSFFVLDHERFAREVLGRWFKHQNFSSFVRQLNMYGFHKIPHLQQGVLKSDTDTEYWNFEHPHFRRGQPDMLCLIQRKKQAIQSAEDAAMDVRDPPHVTAPAANATLSAGQLLDINSIVNGIAAIKRHQAAISADLNELKNSNQVLWQEALASREKYKKQQDTINRILKFLAGVFGNVNSTVHKQEPVDHHPRAMMQLKPQRLMIEHGPSHPAKGVSIVEVQDEDMSHLPAMTQQHPNQYTEPNAPASSPVYLSGIVTEPPTPKPTEAASPTPPTPSPIPTPATPTRITNVPSSAPSIERIPTPTSLTTSPARSASPDALQAAFAEMLNSPGQLQRLLAVLSAQPSFPLSDPTTTPPPGPAPAPPGSENHAAHALASSRLTSYDPYHDLSRVFRDHDGPDPNPTRFAPITDVPSPLLSSSSMQVHEGLLSSPHGPLTQDASLLQKTYRDTEEVDKDVNALHNSINSLIESLGLDPHLITEPSTAHDVIPTAEPDHPGGGGVPLPTELGTAHDDPIAPDFDFNAFLNEFSGGAPDYGDHAHSSAFLDEINSVSDAATPNSMRPESPNIVPTSPTNHKRKSDAAELERGEHPSNNANLGTRIKRKR